MFTNSRAEIPNLLFVIEQKSRWSISPFCIVRWSDHSAKEILKELSSLVNIIILSNIPSTSSLSRINCLKNNDMNYTFISNEGPKNTKCLEMGHGSLKITSDSNSTSNTIYKKLS